MCRSGCVVGTHGHHKMNRFFPGKIGGHDFHDDEDESVLELAHDEVKVVN